MDQAADRSAPRPRGRPRRDADRPPLTRELIARTALEQAAEHGFPALTMRSLAAALGVTVRALYNHVADRQDVIDLVAARIMELHPDTPLDPGDPRGSVRALYRDGRAVYRTLGRALLFSLDETVTPAELHPERILRTERLLAFLTGTGLALEDALAWRGQFLLDLFGHALLIDYTYDRADARIRRAMQDPVPRPWLDAHPDLPAPLARRATTLPALTGDDLFEHMIDRALTTLEHLRHP